MRTWEECLSLPEACLAGGPLDMKAGLEGTSACCPWRGRACSSWLLSHLSQATRLSVFVCAFLSAP